MNIKKKDFALSKFRVFVINFKNPDFFASILRWKSFMRKESENWN